VHSIMYSPSEHRVLLASSANDTVFDYHLDDDEHALVTAAPLWHAEGDGPPADTVHVNSVVEHDGVLYATVFGQRSSAPHGETPLGALIRLPDGAHQLPPEVTPPVERIAKLVARGRVGDGVDREIAACEVLLEGCAKLDLGMPAIGSHVAAKGRHLVQSPALVENPDGAELDAYRNGPSVSEDAAHLFRSR